MDIDLTYDMSIARGRAGFIFIQIPDSIDAKGDNDSELLVCSRARGRPAIIFRIPFISAQRI